MKSNIDLDKDADVNLIFLTTVMKMKIMIRNKMEPKYQSTKIVMQ